MYYYMCTNQKTLVWSWYEIGLGDLCFQPLIQLHCLITSYNFQTNNPLEKKDLFGLIIALHALPSRLRIMGRVYYQNIIFLWIQLLSQWYPDYKCNIISISMILYVLPTAPIIYLIMMRFTFIDTWLGMPRCMESWNTTCTTFIFSDDVLQMLIRYSYDILTPSYPF